MPETSDRNKTWNKQINPIALFGAVSLGGACAIGGALTCFRVAKVGEYIVRTGWNVRGKSGIDVFRRGFVLPVLQRMDRVPEDYFKSYVQKIFPLANSDQRQIFEAAIHGALRVETSKLSIDDINDNREAFQRVAVEQAQLVLNQYGIRINTANIAEIQEDDRGHDEMGYLKARERKKLTEAVQQSEIDVGEATKLGNIGKKERESETRRRVAFLESETKTQENTAMEQIALSQADLAVASAGAKRRSDISLIEANSAAQKIVVSDGMSVLIGNAISVGKTGERVIRTGSVNGRYCEDKHLSDKLSVIG